MPLKRIAAQSPDQLSLDLHGEGFEGSVESKGIFSATYLNRHLRKSQDFGAVTDCEPVFRIAAERWRQHAAGLSRQNEAFTCSTWIEPLLDALGWSRMPQQLMPNDLGTRKRPDYCLFTSSDDFTASSEADPQTLFRKSATVLEAKSWGHPLDRLSSKETPGWFPSQQIQDYLNHAKDANGRRFFNWAILTNGKEWRLYTDRSSVGAYFSFHLVRGTEFCSFDDFRLFCTLFRSQSFERSEDGSCFLDHVREESLRVQADLETNLRRRIFSVLEDLGTAFVSCEENRIAEKDFAEVYGNSLIILYRLLFVLYAESRGLLPVRAYGPGSNRRYAGEFSLARLVERLRNRTLYADNAFTGLYEELLKLFHLVNGTHPRQNEALGVTRYNGGLFNHTQHSRLEDWRIGDNDLANVLRQLIFAQPPARAGQTQGQLSTDEAIDYSTLEVRQLGDIYEGLLGAHFERVGGRLELRNENGENHRHGIYYTPDWIVQFLVRETLSPILHEIQGSDDVRRALKANSEERRRDNSFALAVLRTNLVDPAMGSGHFLVRATEWLADEIMRHPTTQPMTLQIVPQGQRRISREEILARGKIPVSPGIPQEQAELAYWRRRVVEACIYGVDINPMAVELAKLSLWLTCIAPDEPLNFLDHHLRQGNALLSVTPEDLNRAPVPTPDKAPETFDLRGQLQSALGGVIQSTLSIEGQASTEMEVVKNKERLWKEARQKLAPFLELANLWLAALDGVPTDELNYISAAKFLTGAENLDGDQKRKARRFLDSIQDKFAEKIRDLAPFHWRLEFPDVFYGDDGQPLPPETCGFDAVLGNPPYVSVHTAMESGNRKMRDALERRCGYLEDLYVHFADLGFQLLRQNGGFGFIVSDTFFTLASKLRLREMLQSRRLDWLGQCDPFDATVDAAIFVARKAAPMPDHHFRFVQARPLRRSDGTKTTPEKALPSLPPEGQIVWEQADGSIRAGKVRHTDAAELRVHDVPLALFLNAHKKAFFEPRSCTLALFERFNDRVKHLVAEWWEKIEDSRAFATHFAEIQRYHQSLQPGDISLVGLIAEGGQGMRTANNARFLAYLEGTPQAEDIEEKSAAWSQAWLKDAQVAPVFRELLRKAGGNPSRPTADRAAWETAVHALRERFDAGKLGFGRTSLFRIAPRNLIATDDDFHFSFEKRRHELLLRWRGEPLFAPFWNERDLLREIDRRKLREEPDLTAIDFCKLLADLRAWIAKENQQRASVNGLGGRNNLLKQAIPISTLGLRSSEDYRDPSDGPRVAAIYNGLFGRGQFVPFRKGDPEGSRWIDNEPLYCDWSSNAVDWLSSSPLARWQGHKFFLTAGVTWTAVANHVALKARLQEPCIFDADSMRLTPCAGTMSAEAFACLLNSDVLSFYKMRFIQHTQKWEIGNLRQIPIVVPTEEQHTILHELATLAIAAKRHEFAGSAPDNALVSRVRQIGKALRGNAPAYLQPSAQGFLLETPDACLEIIEKAVNWEAEKLYGVEGIGPFDEF
ncbi:MAG: Eco57I restriction-modification methylase domain-containing protein [Verrucomicrobia bacterium]|nr:Eco57I restriction-modification methylase domain-containing protein [Verrucomicrobiota bacterium]